MVLEVLSYEKNKLSYGFGGVILWFWNRNRNRNILLINQAHTGYDIRMVVR